MPNYGMTPRWEKSSEFKAPFDYILGSGAAESVEAADAAEAEGKQVLQVRRVDMGDLIKLGLAEELDFMAKSLVTDDDTKTKPESAKAAVNSAIMKADNFNKMDRMVNLVCGAGILQPRLHMPPMLTETDATTGETTHRVNEAARQKGLVYIDHLPWDDRLELFSVIFESEGLSDFREEQEAPVGDVEHDADVQVPSDGSVALRSDNPEGVLL